LKYIPRSFEQLAKGNTLTYEECITTYGQENAPYCNSVTQPVEEASSLFPGIIGPIIIAIISIVLIVMAITIIRQQQIGVVERLGRYNRSMQPGFHLIIPFFERVVHLVDLEQFNLNVNSAVKTKDDQMVTLPVVVIYKVIPESAEKSVYVVDDPNTAITALVSNEVKAKAATMTLDEIFADRIAIKDSILSTYKDTITAYGFELCEVVIDNPVLPDELQKAYNSIAVAEKAKQAATANGEALKIRLVKEAEANGAALAIQGDAYIVNRDKIAEGNAEAINKMTADTGINGVQALGLLIAIDSNDAIRDASANKGTTVVVATGNSGDGTLGLVASNAS
jgi:regulator of protease activity HflC (stomatin/prohibitin superfamily)